MKRLMIVLVVLVLMVLQGCLASPTGTMVNNYDKYTGRRTLATYLTFQTMTGLNVFNLYYNVEKKQDYMSVKLWCNNWKFIDKVQFICDDNTYSFDEIKHNRKVSGKHVVEEVWFPMSRAFIDDIQTAKNISLRAVGSKGSKELILADVHKLAIINFYKLVETYK